MLIAPRHEVTGARAAPLLARGGQGGKPLSPRTVQLTHAVLHRALADAQLDGLLDDNPAAIARPPRRDPTETVADDDLHIWTPEQVAEFLAGIDDHPLRAVWHVAVGTGGRRGEVLGLRWQDVDLEGRTICIRRSLTVVDGVARLLGTKTSRTRTLSIDSVVADALRREQSAQQRRREAAGRDWADEWGLVFTDAARPPVARHGRGRRGCTRGSHPRTGRGLILLIRNTGVECGRRGDRS